MTKSAKKEMTIGRVFLIEGVKKVLWACAYEANKEVLYNWRLTANKNSVRFVAGTGGIFHVVDVIGKGAKTNGDVEFLIHKDQTVAILDVLETAPDENVIIRQSEQTNDAPAQITVQLEHRSIVFVGIDTTANYPPIDNIIPRKSEYQIKTKVSDWNFPTKGLEAIFTKEYSAQHEIVEADISFDLDKKLAFSTSVAGLKSHREVTISEIVSLGDNKNDLVFRCQINHLGNMAKNLTQDENLTFEFLHEKGKPVIVKIPEKDNKSWAPPETLKVREMIILATVKR
jgi:hypothetical protein